MFGVVFLGCIVVVFGLCVRCCCPLGVCVIVARLAFVVVVMLVCAAFLCWCVLLL